MELHLGTVAAGAIITGGLGIISGTVARNTLDSQKAGIGGAMVPPALGLLAGGAVANVGLSKAARKRLEAGFGAVSVARAERAAAKFDRLTDHGLSGVLGAVIGSGVALAIAGRDD